MPGLVERVINSFGPEDYEQYGFVQWLDVISVTYPLKYTSIPNSTYTKSVMQRTRNRLLGLRPGLCDMVVAYPGCWLVFIEMKRQKGGVVSQAQKEWIAVLNTIPNIEAHVCRGAEEARRVIEELLGASPALSPARSETPPTPGDTIF